MLFTRSYILLSFNLSINTCPAGILVEITNHKYNLKHLVMKYKNNNLKIRFFHPKYYHVITWALNFVVLQTVPASSIEILNV